MKAFLGKRRKYLVFLWGTMELDCMKGEACCLHSSSPPHPDHSTVGKEEHGATGQKLVYKANYKSEGSCGKQISLCDIQGFSGNVTNGTAVFQRMILLVAITLCACLSPSSLTYLYCKLFKVEAILLCLYKGLHSEDSISPEISMSS